ncbi:MAG: anthranilate synthase component I family protein [Planctomycetota bacterium]
MTAAAPLDDALAAWLDAPPSACLLHAGRPHPRWSNRSLLGTPDAAWVVTPDGRSAWLGDAPRPVDFTHDPFADLDALLAHDPDASWIGYLGYDLGRRIESLTSVARDDRRWPLALLQRCPRVDAFPATERPIPTPNPSLSLGPVRSCTTPSDYQQAVAHVVDRLHAGDAFEVNLATRLTAEFRGRPRDLFLALLRRSPAWFAAYLPLPALPNDPPDRRRAIASVSPELFLELTPEGTVTTRPIKGTRRAGSAAAAAHPHADLADSPKDRAELAMVVDMLRNDLGRVAAFGSVRVDQPRTIEHHPGIDHAVATVAAKLRRDATPGDLLRATLPGGSITGAPKVQAMHMIERLEPVRRGPYCGAIGWLRGRSMHLSIAIRTACITTDALGADGDAPPTGVADFHVGSGIVADSIPRAEWRETLHKAKPFRDAARAHRRL